MEHDRNVEEKIRLRAYHIWLEEGCPAGREKENWQRAESELIGGQSPPLQPDTPIGQASQAEQKANANISGGVNPDDITR
jgi:hypothetical protein